MESKLILVLERSGLVAADIEETIKETYPTTRVLQAGSIESGEKIALSNDRIDLAIVSSFTDQLPRSTLMRHLEASSTALAISAAADADMSAFGSAYRLPTPFTSCAIRHLLEKVSRADAADAGPSDPP